MRTKDPKFQRLQSLEVLRDLPQRQLRQLAPTVDEVTLDSGDVLIHQGQLNRHAYFIVDGSVGIDVDGQRVAVVTAGSIVGERSALERGLANATVTVLEPSRVMAVEHRVLLGAASQADDFGARLHALAEARTNEAA